MATEMLDVVDTAVKIGLGALISGVAAYCVTKLNQKGQRAEQIVKRKWEMYESALDAANEYSIALAKYFRAIDGVRRAHPSAVTIDEVEVNESGVKEYLGNENDELAESVARRIHAISRLKIIGKKEAAESLGLFHALEEEIRIKVTFDGVLPTAEELKVWRDKLRSIRERFLTEMSASLKG